MCTGCSQGAGPDHKLQPNHDAHVVAATKQFRDCGFALSAMQFKRSPVALKALRDFNRVPETWRHPFAWNFHPNAYCKEQSP